MPLVSTRTSRAALGPALLLLIVSQPELSRPLAAQGSATVAPSDSTPIPRAQPADSTGADLAVIFPDSLPDMPRTMSDLLAARAPGVFVQRSTGAAGASAWISMRDAGAVFGLQPLVIVDGVRRLPSLALRNGIGTAIFGLPGERLPPVSLDDIPVDQIERVEILRGPAAAARYGRDARYGVIAVTTRPPDAGRLRVRASVGGGYASEQARFPANFANLTTDGYACPNAAAAIGSCTQVGTSSYTVLRDRNPFRSGARRVASVNASGGAGRVALAFGVSHDHATGVLPMDGTDHTALTARVHVPFGAHVRLSVGAQAAFRSVTQPSQGESVREVIAGAIFALPRDCSLSTPCRTDSTSHGYRYGTPEFLAGMGTRRRVQHFSQGATLDIDAAPWLASQSLISIDGMNVRGSHDETSPPGSINTVVTEQDVASHARLVRLEQLLRASWMFVGFPSTTTLALSADRARTRETTDTRMVSGGRQFTASSGLTTIDRRTSVRMEQRASAGERLSLGFGALWTRTELTPPSVALRHTIDGFADASLRLVAATNVTRTLQSLRLRAAMGQVSGYDPRVLSGMQRGPLNFYPGPGPLDSPRLLPQRSLELESGVNAEFSPAHLGLALTAFRRLDTEPYVTAPVPQPSSVSYRSVEMRRRVTGLELTADAMPIDAERLRWMVHGYFALANDRVTRWAPRFTAIGMPAAWRIIEVGKSFDSWRERPFDWSDANGDGIINFGELTYPSTPWAGRARTRPSQFAALQNSITVLRALTIGAQLDYVGGHQVLNAAGATQCVAGTCPAINDRRAPLAEQARGVAALATSTFAGFLESGATVRLRELSVSLGSARMAGLARAGSLRVTLAARNLATWSRYRGLDPEIDLPNPGVRYDDATLLPHLFVPNTRQLTARLTLAY